MCRYREERNKEKFNMKRALAILMTACLMTVFLVACGERAGRSNAGIDDNGSGMPGRYSTGMNNGESKDAAVYRSKNASANAKLRGDSRSVTGTPADPDTPSRSGMLAADEETDSRAAEVRYQLMLDNARVHDRNGFLFDGENAHHATW